MKTRPWPLVSLGFALAVPVTLIAQIPHPDRLVEFVGLHHWTPQMIADSLARYSPGTSLENSGALLRKRFKFPAVAVTYYGTSPTSFLDGVVVVVDEPSDSTLAKRSSLPMDSVADRSIWRATLAPFLNRTTRAFNGELFGNSLAGYGAFLTLGRDSAREAVIGAVSPDAAEAVWHALASDTADTNRTLALWTLGHDRNDRNRMAAAAVLANFPMNDTTWWALAAALRDSSDLVAGTAGTSLETLSRRFPRTVDWAPIAPLLRDLLNGANPWELSTILTMLAETHVSGALAPALLKGGGSMIVGCLATNFALLREPAHALLVQLSGRDLGEEPTLWAAWIKRL